MTIPAYTNTTRHSYLSILKCCSEAKHSPLFAAAKLLALSALTIKTSTINPENKNSLLVCLQTSYKQKAHIYDQIAKSLDCGILTIHFGLPFRTPPLPDLRQHRLFFWSDVQIKALLFIKKHLEPGKKYGVFQHGAFPHNDSSLTPAIRQEWEGTSCEHYYAWTEPDQARIGATRPDLNIRVIGAPCEEKREVIDGYGFATRGPEYLAADIDYLIHANVEKNQILIFFHPAYKKKARMKFMKKCHDAGFTPKEGENKLITKNIITLSRSFIDIAKASSVKTLTSDASKV